MLRVTAVAIIFLIHLSFLGIAQDNGSILGRVLNSSNTEIPSASVSIKGLKYACKADRNGDYKLTAVPAGTYMLVASAMGYKTQEVKIKSNGTTPITYVFILETDHRELEQIDILGRSETDEINRQAYNVTAIDAKKLANTTMDIGQALNRVSGVRIRESGGMGSNMNISLNGFSGNQVKVFIDGLPMSNFGSSFQLNNIPINFAERVEVYRGVVPVWLGGDALGGAINIVTRTDPGKYVDASYSYGSFNTHKTSVNAGFVGKSGLTFQLNAFQNYSDNNYWVDVDILNVDRADREKYRTYTYDQRVRQFHNKYHNETLVANIGVSNKKYADQLLFGITLGQNKKEIQNGNHMKTVYGGRESLGNIVQPSFKYVKNNLFTEGLNVSMSGRYNLGKERTLDTVARRFNWAGESEPKYPDNPNQKGGEDELRDYRYRNNNSVFSANVNYTFHEKHSLILNHQFTGFNRKGYNSLQPDLLDNNIPNKTFKNITGLGYGYAINTKWNVNVFTKYYHQKTVSNTLNSGTIVRQDTSTGYGGYGIATTYFIIPDLQLKTSFERAIRLPENTELFGDLENQSPNPRLRPESSYNFNFGISYFKKFGDSHRMSIDANYLYRDARDFIRPFTGQEDVNGKRKMQYVNLRKAVNNSFDINMRYYYKSLLSLGGTMTYQNLLNNTKVEPSKIVESSIYKNRLPNIPYTYGNFDANVYFQDFLDKGAVLNVGYNLLYVHDFFLDWASYATPSARFVVPSQLSHDLNLVYTLKSGKYNIAFECLNFTDAKRYDNFALQKPGRSFNLKLRYFIKNNNI
ncbi:TonB-dependent receptor [Sphingobacterium tabacisoli]|uniref:TonB-dependent receptor n=1 Tax=Sphingobacterium tabacisoli TaxID=2044855 RepID=A0ABW5L7T9_9SPHI|nr:TonB-dependent receptor [Sphingobacterium tabacisoli]